MKNSLADDARAGEPPGETRRAERSGPGDGSMSPSAAAALGWLLVALGNAVGIAAVPLAGLDPWTRLLHLLFDAGHTLSLALTAYGLTALWRSFGPARFRWALLVLALASTALFNLVLAKDLSGAVERWTNSTEVGWLIAIGCTLLALAVPTAVVIGRWSSRFGYIGRGLGVAVALGVVVANHHVLESGYAGAHFWLATLAATLLGASLTGLELGRARRVTAWSRPLLAAAVAAALVSLLVAPPSRVELELIERDTAFLAPLLSGFRIPKRLAKANVPRELRRWFEPRADRPELPPHPTALVGDGGIVVVVTVDALRFDVFSPKHRRLLPNLNELRQNSAFFTQTRSFGSDTRFSLGALFTGRYIAMTEWTGLFGNRPTLERDKLPRLPELLAEHGVETSTAVALPKILSRRVGILRGFAEHVMVDGGDRMQGTPEIIDHAIERLRHQGSGSLFYYTHLMDPHLPYDKHGKRADSPHAAYMREVAHVDQHIGRLRKAIRDLGLAQRTLLIVSSDHGEAFGEHGQRAHNRPLYEVQVHVPLLVEYPGVKPRSIDAHVSTLDIGPTVFDALRVPTPGYWMAESLVPLLLGEKVNDHRPIYMERALTRALLFPNGLKVMLRSNDRFAQIYDIKRDPAELEDLRESLGPEGDHLHALARAYARVHTSRPRPP